MARSRRHNMIAAAAEEGISIHNKRAGPLVNKRDEDCLKISLNNRTLGCHSAA